MFGASADERIGIEVDGPHHFCTNMLTLTGDTIARQKLLQARGWALISVPYFHWASADDGQRAAMLQAVRKPHLLN
jgi:hypothetical protein